MHNHKDKVKTDGTLVPPYIPAAPAFTDEEGEVYRARVEDDAVIALTGVTDDETYVVRFFKADALKIINLIAEAAK